MLLCVSLALLLLACSAKGAVDAGQSNTTLQIVDLATIPGNKFKVIYRPSTVVITPNAVQNNLISVTDDGATFAFGTGDAGITKLKAGDVVLFSNLALRKVTAVDSQNDVFLVQTQAAALTDAIAEGDIGWHQNIDFGAVSSARPNSFDPIGAFLESHSTAAAASGTLSQKLGKLFPGSSKERDWEIVRSATLSANRLDFTIEAKKSTGGADLAITTKGYIQGFDSDVHVQISHGAMQSFSFNNKNLRGAMDLTVDVQKPRSGVVTSEKDQPALEVPAIVKWPFYIEGIPFIFEINAKLLLRPGMANKNQDAHANFHVVFNGVQGFTATPGGGVRKSGSPGALFSITKSNSLTLAPFALIVGAAAPRFVLALNPAESFVIMLEKLLPQSSRIAEAAKALDKSTVLSKIGSFITKTGNYVANKIASKPKKMILGNKAEAYVEFVTVGTILNSGPMAIVPCTKATLTLSLKGGYETALLGRDGPSNDVIIGAREIEKVIPEGYKRCG